MAEAGVGKRKPRQLTELADVHDFLEEVRLRPGMWIRRSSLQHLDSMLVGYRVALGVHGVDEGYDFWSPGNQGPFADWLGKRLGWSHPSALGWAVEIERQAAASDTPPIELFFTLWDEYRADRDAPDE